jgi:hypothetical protein
MQKVFIFRNDCQRMLCTITNLDAIRRDANHYLTPCPEDDRAVASLENGLHGRVLASPKLLVDHGQRYINTF